MIPDISQHPDVLHAPGTAASIKLNTASLVAKSHPHKHILIIRGIWVLVDLRSIRQGL